MAQAIRLRQHRVISKQSICAKMQGKGAQSPGAVARLPLAACAATLTAVI